ncbi:DNA-directed RNA polymerase [Mucidula mucida]|nr:DNA-directed RNA polymerase [Mucidula mucida]
MDHDREVPTVAIEHVYVWNNTTVIQDEVLAQRIGLVPLNVDPEPMEMRTPGNDAPTDHNTIVFHVKLECTRNPKPRPGATEPEDLYINSEFLSSHLIWRPEGEQPTLFGDNPPAPTNPNIIDMHAIKGVGKDHAKFSPVATASYRLLPHIKILKPIPPPLAEKFQRCFAPGVIKVDPRTKEVSVDPHGVRNDTVSREVLRHPEFEGHVELSRVRDFFMFNVESESAYPPERLLPEAIAVMRTKISEIKAGVELLRNPAESQTW